MKTLLIILLTCFAFTAKSQSIDRIISDMLDSKIKAYGKDTVLYVGKGIKLDTIGGRATLNVDPAYITSIAKTIPIDNNALLTLLKSVPVYTTAQRNLLKPIEGQVIYNRTIDTYQIYQGGAWK